MRTRAAAVAVRDGQVLVIGRRKDGREYAVLPGGGVEAGETATEACLRELREETGLEGTLLGQLPLPLDQESSALFFAVTVDGGSPRIGGPELARTSAQNVYEPQWVPLSALEEIGLVPPEAVTAVRSVQTVTMPTAVGRKNPSAT